MTQDTGRQPTTRRSTRGRNRPLLVTSTSTASENEAPKQTTDETLPTLARSATEVQAQNTPVAPSRRRLPSFFSTVGKNKEDAAQEKDIAQARIARATRVKAAPTKTTGESSSEAEDEPKKAPAKPARPATPARPTSAFKTRYIFGMVIYLLAANFVGIFTTQFFQSNHLDSKLLQFPLFGSQIVISTSTLAFLTILIILLVLLARFDLIPRSFGAMAGQQPTSRNRRSGSSSSTSEESRTPPPTMRQGVKGADDDLYREYRTNQRKKK
jgi:hypothetical protein